MKEDSCYKDYQQKCIICAKILLKGVEADPHDCPLSYDGLSKAMEADGALEIVKRIFNKIRKDCM